MTGARRAGLGLSAGLWLVAVGAGSAQVSTPALPAEVVSRVTELVGRGLKAPETARYWPGDGIG